MRAPVVIPTPYATLHLCDVCGQFGCLDSHGLCDAVNPEQTAGCFREPFHEGLHTFEIGRAIAQEPAEQGKSNG